jgi:fumarate reductase flavoprotein subunit
MGVEMKRIEADIVVLSAGTAGLPAAVTAAEAGTRVIVLERTGRTGGTANLGNDIFGVGSRFQQAYPPVMTPEEAFQTHMDWTHWRVDPQLVSAFFNKSGSTIDWLEDMGVKFRPPRENPDGTRAGGTMMIIGKQPGSKKVGQAAEMAKLLTKRAKDLGVQFLMKTPAQRILKMGGRIVGVIATNEAGEEIRIEAKAVIIATGGFAGNKEWVKKYTGYNEGQNLVALSKIGKGDGIRMAWEVGAAASPMMIGLNHDLPPPCNCKEFSAFSQSENIMVNMLGERFLNDDLRGSQGEAGIHGTVASCLALQKGKAGFMIFDEALKKYYASKLSPFPGGPIRHQPTFKHEDLDDNIREVLATGYKFIFMADSLDDLCAQTGISSEGLKKTLAEYNKFCEQGRDERFYKNPKYLKPIAGPKYYAGKFIAGAYGTCGGIKTNFKMEVLTEDYDVIPGLYAAGNDANNMYDHSYTPLSGNHIGFAVNSGRIAGENAVRYVSGV